MHEHHERIADAGEYVLGTLGFAERQAVERRLAREPVLLAEVYSWQDRLLGLHAHTMPMAVRPGVWSRIESQLGPHPAAAPVGAANDPSWRSLRFWRLAAGCGLAASLVLGSLLGLQRWPGTAPSPGPRYLVLLQAPGAHDTGWVVEAAAGGMVRLVPVGPTAAVPPGKTLQFWTKPEGASRPTSLGLVRAGQVVEVPAAQLPGLGARQLFELTLEPEGGSPVGRPTGPILFVGRALTL
ncbi:RNA polymerase subunit sigma-70 [Aquabacterium olei]|uniref:RNA polymerase subunit sigma-70 n=1 Tax=Aquabacterium olei TaxID=1296669 RepID=A0A2U8FUY4_9BURK|nr:anti-sigma factor [Aquabacterium olei]AWI54875.1 RNA polymerase subunit sigma-70 [Aquabacterium olei]